MAYTAIDKPTDYVQCIGWSTPGTNSSGAGATYTLTTNFGWIPDMFLHYNRGDAIHINAPFMHYNGSSGTQRSSIQTDYSNLGKCELAAAAPSYEAGETGYASAASTSTITFTHGTHGDAGGSSKGMHFKQTDGTFVGLAWRFDNGGTGGTSLTTTTAGDIDGICCIGTDIGMSLVTYNSDGNGVDVTVAHGLTGYNPDFKWLIPVSRRGTSDNRFWVRNNHNTESYRYSKQWGADEDFDDMSSGAMLWGITGTAGDGEPESQYTQTTHTRLGHANHGTRQSGEYASQDIIDYAFLWCHNVQGFSRYNTYVGNGGYNDDGPFVWCGFKPAIVIIDTADGSNTEIGLMYDNIAAYGNDINPRSNPRETGVGAIAATGQEIDFLANGFKIRNDDIQLNTSGQKYVYMAWAEASSIDSAGNPLPAQ